MPGAKAQLIAEVDAAVAAFFFEVPIADVATTLSSGSIIATSVVTAPTVVAYTAPVVLSTGFGAATVVVITDNGSDRMGPGGNGEAGGMGMGYSEGGKGGKGAGAEGGKGGSGKGLRGRLGREGRHGPVRGRQGNLRWTLQR